MDLLLDDDDDLALGDDLDLVMVTGADAVKQDSKITLKTFKGDWFLDADLGVMDYDTFFGKAGTDADRAARVRSALQAVPGVISITSVTVVSDPITATRTITAMGTCTDGALDLTVVPLA